MTGRQPLSVERIVGAAVGVADGGGLAAVSMRNVAGALGVEAMSLYHHVKDKDALLDALADWAFLQMETPVIGSPWRAAMVARAASARTVLSAHPWALGLLESRPSPGPAVLTHHDAVLGTLRAAGFSVALAGHAFSVLDAYVFGFVLTELNLPFDEVDPDTFMEGLDLSAFPHLAETVVAKLGAGSYDYGDEFEVGLDLILDALAARLANQG